MGRISLGWPHRRGRAGLIACARGCLECVETAPEWIAERATHARDRLLSGHARHSTAPFPEIAPCGHCSTSNSASWKKLTQNIYLGDPFAIRFNGVLSYVEPEFFREGAGTWEGQPVF